MRGKECAYYTSMAGSLGEEFVAQYPPCSPDEDAINAFVAELNALLATEPDAISAHLKALQKSTGCLALFSNSEQTPEQLKILLQTIRERRECAAIKHLPEKVG